MNKQKYVETKKFDHNFCFQFNEFQLSKPTVLIVEDDPFSQKLFSYVISTISNTFSSEIIKEFEDLKFKIKDLNEIKLAIIDINLGSDKSGIDVIEFIKSYYPNIPCFLTTGLPVESYRKLISKLNYKVPILRKPFMPERCKKLIEHLLYYKKGTI